MRQIELVGPVDKRLVAYPLFHICDILGRTLVVTDDANFRRFADNYEDRFILGRSDFVVVNDISQSIIEELGVKFSSYDYVIIISTNVLIEGNDLLVYCHGNSQMICTEDVLENIEELEHQDVTISIRKPSGKGALYLSADSKSFGYVWDCEENKRFIGCKHSDLVKLSSYLFASTLSISVEEYNKTIQRDV